ncbi:MAG: hypothetical protein ACYCU7_01940 [Acidimicrobiales bacterium]
MPSAAAQKLGTYPPRPSAALSLLERVVEAASSLARDGDARKAAVARRFATRKLADQPVRGILDPDRSVLDHFEPITRYGRIEADQLVA